MQMFRTFFAPSGITGDMLLKAIYLVEDE